MTEPKETPENTALGGSELNCLVSCDEYQKVAALVCLDIDTIVAAAETRPEMAMGFLKMLKEKKDNVVHDKKCRNMRYAACCNVFTIAAQRSDS